MLCQMALDEAVRYGTEKNRRVSPGTFVSWMLKRGARANEFSSHDLLERVQMAKRH